MKKEDFTGIWILFILFTLGSLFGYFVHDIHGDQTKTIYNCFWKEVRLPTEVNEGEPFGIFPKINNETGLLDGEIIYEKICNEWGYIK